LRALCRSLGGPRALDLGCATGQTLLHLCGVIVAGVGVDIAPLMIDRARQNAGTEPVRFHVGDATDFCVGCSERFELVLLVGVLEHLGDPAAALDGARRVLATNGRLVVIMPHPWGPAFCFSRFALRSNAPPARHLSPLRLRAIGADHGLELKAIRALPYTPWPTAGRAGDTRNPKAQATGRNPLAGMLRGAYSAEFAHRLA
jgi:SAM-dependent methyltransferase